MGEKDTGLGVLFILSSILLVVVVDVAAIIIGIFNNYKKIISKKSKNSRKTLKERINFKKKNELTK